MRHEKTKHQSLRETPVQTWELKNPGQKNGGGSNIDTLVEVLGRYSNLCDQGERLRNLLEFVPEEPESVNLPAPKQIQHRLEPPEINRLQQAYESGVTLRDLARDFQIHRITAADLLERSRIARRGKGPSDSEVQEAMFVPTPDVSHRRRALPDVPSSFPASLRRDRIVLGCG
jgi:hypothetical protein